MLGPRFSSVGRSKLKVEIHQPTTFFLAQPFQVQFQIMGIHIWDFSQCVVEIYLIFGWESSLERNFLPHQQCGGEKKHCGGKKKSSSTHGSS